MKSEESCMLVREQLEFNHGLLANTIITGNTIFNLKVLIGSIHFLKPADTRFSFIQEIPTVLFQHTEQQDGFKILTGMSRMTGKHGTSITEMKMILKSFFKFKDTLLSMTV